MKKIDSNVPLTSDIRGAMQIFGFGKNKMTQIANEAGAVIVFNSRTKRYDIPKIYDYLRSMNERGDGNE